jgi:hypothetical protein
MWKATHRCGCNLSSFAVPIPFDISRRPRQNALQLFRKPHYPGFLGGSKSCHLPQCNTSRCSLFASHRQKLHQILSLRRQLKSSSRCGQSSSNFTCIPWKGMCQEREMGKAKAVEERKGSLRIHRYFYAVRLAICPCLIRVYGVRVDVEALRR